MLLIADEGIGSLWTTCRAYMHGGTIAIESQVGVGTSFIVTLAALL